MINRISWISLSCCYGFINQTCITSLSNVSESWSAVSCLWRKYRHKIAQAAEALSSRMCQHWKIILYEIRQCQGQPWTTNWPNQGPRPKARGGDHRFLLQVKMNGRHRNLQMLILITIINFMPHYPTCFDAIPECTWHPRDHCWRQCCQSLISQLSSLCVFVSGSSDARSSFRVYEYSFALRMFFAL